MRTHAPIPQQHFAAPLSRPHYRPPHSRILATASLDTCLGLPCKTSERRSFLNSQTLATRVGEPASPSFSAGNPRSLAPYVDSVLLVTWIIPITSGIRGSLTALFTVISAGSFISTFIQPLSKLASTRQV